MRADRPTTALLTILLLAAGLATTATAQSPMASSGRDTTAAPIDTSAWTTYVSDRYGFSIGHPADWVEVPADHTWSFPADHDWLSPAQESFHAPDRSIRASAWSVAMDPGTTPDAWISTYCPMSTTPCPPPADRIVPVTMDGHPGSLVQFADDTQAFILAGDRMYVVAVWEPDSDPRTSPYGGATRLLEGYLSTMHLLPGGPATESGPPSPSRS